MLDVVMLGGQRLRTGAPEDGSASALPSRALLLLGYLALRAGTPQPRSHIATLFWPDSSEPQGRTNLRRELHHLRAALGGDESLEVSAATLTWRDRPTCRVDVRSLARAHSAAIRALRDDDADAAAEQAARALEIYRGPLLPGALDEWVLADRQDLHRRCVELCDLAADAAATVGRLDRAVGFARRRVQLEPLEEEGYRRLIDLQSELGDRSAALATYHRCVSILERELGISPSPGVVRAARRLRAGAGQAPDLSPAPEREVGPRWGAAQAPLVERDAEVERLMACWDAAGRGQPVVAVIRGQAGVGKSRLAEEVMARLGAQGVAVAFARCFPRSGQPALAPVRDWLRCADLRAGVESLAAPWRKEVERLVPEVSPAAVSGSPTEVERDPEIGGRGDVWRRTRFFDGLARAAFATRRPTLLVLDNLQWCDVETLAWLSFVVGRTLEDHQQVMVLATGRDLALGEPHDASVWLDGMRSGAAAQVVDVLPLDHGATATLGGHLLRRALTTSEIDLLHATSGGFPLYVVEATRASGPNKAVGEADLGAVLTHRLDEASPLARDIAGLAACVGRDFDLDLLTEASDEEADRVVDAVDELWRRRILHELPRGYDFSHDLLRDAAFAMVSPPRRWLLHRRLAQGLELLHSDRPEEVAVQLAGLYERGGRVERALDYYRLAAQQAADVFATLDAVQHYRSCLQLLLTVPPSTARDGRELELLFAMAPPLNAAHGYTSAPLVEHFERLVELADRLGRRTTLLASVVGLWASRFVQGRHLEAQGLATRAEELARFVPELAPQAHFTLGGSAAAFARHAEAVHHFDEVWAADAGAVSMAVGTRPRLHARAWAAHPRWMLGDVDGARQCRDDAVREARASGTPYDLVVTLAYAAITDQLLGERDVVLRTATELNTLCERHGVAYYREWGVVLHGWAQGGAAGIDQMTLGIDRLVRQGAFARMPYWLTLRADRRMEVGDVSAGQADLELARVSAEERGDVAWLPEVLRRANAARTAGT